MKKINLFLLSLALCFAATAQKEDLKVETFHLSNGLKVIVNSF